MLYKLLFAASIAATFTACANSGDAAKTGDTTGNGPVETRPPNTKYKPAFDGQTRIKGVKTSVTYDRSAINESLNKPWGIASLPDGRLLITEKGGTMRIATTSGQVSEPITGLPKVDDKGQGGLLGLAIDPQFATNRTVYWVFSERVDTGNLTAVGKGMLAPDEKTIQRATVIYRATPSYDGDKHYGGRIVFDRAGNLVISTGERSDKETRHQAQDKNSGLGKMINITTSGQPAAGNPLGGSRAEFISYGHRSPQGLAIHPETGDLWESEMGPRGGDEVNIIKPGKNYGWPTITYGIEYNGDQVGLAKTQEAGLEQPIYYWDPVLSPSGMTFYSGTAIPEWKNNLFICGLNSQHIARLVIQNNKVVGEERLLSTEGQRFRDITQGRDGYLYAVTDGGRLYKIGKAG